jgi:hypothetical protein
MVRIYAPEGALQQNVVRLTPLPDPTSALRIGVLHNNKSNADVLLQTAAQHLAELLGAPAPVLTEKPRASLPADPETIATLKREADLVFVGTAD